jgi:hypothetical protein
MLLSCGEDNDVRIAGRTSQSTDRIARTIGIVVVCGYFVRSTMLCFTDHQGHHRPLSNIPPAARPSGNEPFCRAFSSPLVIAVDAGGTFPAFT